jgi:predicted CDP-diglyceride synthetase/phosphatidate cytidylyltransferase
MQSNLSLSITTTASGMLGGVSKAISEKLTLCAITTQGVIDVAFYALISASVGYLVKVSFDSLKKSINSKKKQA